MCSRLVRDCMCFGFAIMRARKSFKLMCQNDRPCRATTGRPYLCFARKVADGRLLYSNCYIEYWIPVSRKIKTCSIKRYPLIFIYQICAVNITFVYVTQHALIVFKLTIFNHYFVFLNRQIHLKRLLCKLQTCLFAP